MSHFHIAALGMVIFIPLIYCLQNLHFTPKVTKGRHIKVPPAGQEGVFEARQGAFAAYPPRAPFTSGTTVSFVSTLLRYSTFPLTRQEVYSVKQEKSLSDIMANQPQTCLWACNFPHQRTIPLRILWQISLKHASGHVISWTQNLLIYRIQTHDNRRTCHG